MDAETSPTSRVVAAVPAAGATYAAIVHRTGMSRPKVDAGLLGALRARLLVRRDDGVFLPKFISPKDAEPIPRNLDRSNGIAAQSAKQRYAAIRARFEAGESMESIAAGERCRPAHVRRLLRLAGMRFRSTPKLYVRATDKQFREAAKLHREGFTMNQIADRLGTTRTSARVWVKKGRGL